MNRLAPPKGSIPTTGGPCYCILSKCTGGCKNGDVRGLWPVARGDPTRHPQYVETNYSLRRGVGPTFIFRYTCAKCQKKKMLKKKQSPKPNLTTKTTERNVSDPQVVFGFGFESFSYSYQ